MAEEGGSASTAPEVDTVLAWHEALNSGDLEALTALSAPDVEVGGPRGTGRGAELLRDWAESSGIQLGPRRVFHHAQTVVVEQDAAWSFAETGETASEQTVATVFVVRDLMVASVVRYPDLAEALSVAGLEESSEAVLGASTQGDPAVTFAETALPEAPGSSYEAAGVSIERGEEAVALMRSAVEKTHGPEVLGGPGGFAGLYALAGYREPVLASTIDGVGTKVLVAKEMERFDTLGADIVNHCADDVLATGARPLLFLDYIATGRLDPAAIARVVRGAAEACESLGIALIGGETAEMPDLYAAGDFDLVGVCVGACERSEVPMESAAQPGDAILGLASSGLHTNGYTLARKVLADAGISLTDTPEGFDRPIGEVYLEPHRSYVRPVGALREAVEVRGMAHITGGGLPGNLSRALGGLGARLWADSWPEPAVFGLIRSVGGVPEAEMRRVFNLGVGFCAVVAAEDAEKGLGVIRGAGCEAWRIGEVAAAPSGGVGFV